MKGNVKFTFKRNVGQNDLERHLSTAIVTAECVFGQAKVRLNAGYIATNSKAVIDVASPVGEHIAEVFTGLLIKEYGETSFTVERIRDESHQRS